ncbi:MAG: DUF3341 domain-containing protein [Myxococcales bacterium]|nr:DUF3341 domain-containing protein [Myxococcales bacterium]
MSVAVPVELAAAASPVKAVYAHMDCLMTGIVNLKKAGFTDLMVMTPMPRHEVEEAVYEGEPSPVRWFTLCGGLFGGTMVFSLMSLTHANWPMILPGGKPVVSVPPFMVITFEGTVLWAALGTLVGLLLNCRLPATDLPEEACDPRFSSDCFGIVLERVGANDAAQIRHILEHSGAIEVTGGVAASPGAVANHGDSHHG